MKGVKFFILSATMVLTFNAGVFAMRTPPKPVATIDHNNVIYSVPHFVQCLSDKSEPEQNGGYVLARDKKTKRIKWLVQIYVTKYDKSMEQDVQDIFITEIKLNEDMLIIKDEKNRTFSLNLNTLEVKTLSS